MAKPAKKKGGGAIVFIASGVNDADDAGGSAVIVASQSQPQEASDGTEGYSDSQALADGTLVDVGPLGLTFRGLPLNRLAGELRKAIQSTLDAEKARHEECGACYLERVALRNWLALQMRLAVQRAGIWQVPGAPALWLLLNEVGGYTLLRPEDY